ncbi:phage portal protein [Enterococcus dongliensis]|uniref:Phage portal protein n=1 Tax=Enterococcus dongliensis TaxID=2559925 RepID=A0ABU3EQB0_9ENTE|nr:phage portal protein [Enterococcus dongliensis]MDT2597038.1 phage portal protein [Enterococcus dongliensis]
MTFDRDEDITPEVIAKFMRIHQLELPRYQYLMNCYKGQMEIYDYAKKDSYKPDNRLVVNFPKYITDTFTGYFNGVPIKKSHPDDTYNQAITAFDGLNDMEDEESELAKMACVYGRCYEFMYQNEDTETCVVYNSPEDMFLVYDNSVKQAPLFAVRYGLDDDNVFQGEYYGPDGNRKLTGSTSALQFGEELDDYYGELPVTEFYFNEERMSIFESVISLFNAFNKAISEKANDVEYFSDQYIAFLGAEIEEKDLTKIRDNRTINYYGSNADKVDVKFLDKPDSDSQTENLLDRLQKLIFQTSMVANISDESFGQASGTALAYKLEAMSNLALAFQRKYQSALNKRYKLFSSLATNVPASQSNAWRELEYTFTRNEPKDIKSQAETAQMLMGVTSEETALSVLSVVSDVKTEIDKIDAEKPKTGTVPAYDFEKGASNENEDL